jgi:uncharacterized membrane protein (DUF441 family)
MEKHIMTFFRSIGILTAVCLCIAFAYFVGHGLALHDRMPMIYGTGLLVLGTAMIGFFTRDRIRNG